MLTAQLSYDFYCHKLTVHYNICVYMCVMNKIITIKGNKYWTSHTPPPPCHIMVKFVGYSIFLEAGFKSVRMQQEIYKCSNGTPRIMEIVKL